nr:hypothetical protein CFP56_09687 [Quercus suber]
MNSKSTPIVEAWSLSSLTSTASQPPLDPTSQVPSPALPLVLYIARVPGSRDVFLTPLKPREKIVTAEDVQSSLYYIHIHCEDHHDELETSKPASIITDTSNIRTLRHEDHATDRQPPPPPPPLPARPVTIPALPPYPIHDQMPDRGPMPTSPQKINRIARKPVLADVTNKGNTSPSLGRPDRPNLPPRPLPALPIEHSSDSSLHVENVRVLRHSEHSEDMNPYLRKYELPARVELLDAPEPDPGTLTLIRRDPGSSEQWNVASIHDPPIHEITSTAPLNMTAARRMKKSGAPLYLDVTNPGYGAFIDPDRSQSRTSTSSATSSNDAAPEGIFRRRLYMPGSRYGEHNYSHLKSGSDNSGNTSNHDVPRSAQANSYDSAATANNTPPSFDRRTKGYAFNSPWDGHCEFSTGTTGKTLKCFHTLGRHSTTEVSELRFNLPTKSKLPQAAEKRSSYFAHQRHQSIAEWEGGVDAPTIMIGEDGRIDRSLGQENAGGGFGGKQAKLGKLIIAPEGLKMLDLLVAANMGLWWRAYERS